MKTVFTLLAALIFSGLAHATTPTLDQVIEKVSDECAGNGNGSVIRKYNLRRFSAARAMSELKEPGGPNTCPRTYSKSLADGVQLTTDYLKQDSCIDEALNHDEFDVLLAAVANPSNKAVLASLYDATSDDNPEACSYWYFEIYMNDGRVIDMEFNETD